MEEITNSIQKNYPGLPEMDMSGVIFNYFGIFYRMEILKLYLSDFLGDLALRLIR